jgi:hypothetical protein
VRGDISTPLEDANWVDLRDARAPMAQRLDGTLSEAARRVVSRAKTALTPWYNRQALGGESTLPLEEHMI